MDVDLATLDLVPNTFEIAGRRWTIRSVRDQQSLLAALDRLDEFPFGLLLWESAPALAAALVERVPDLTGKTVLELGAGAGLPGLVAAHLGAEVTQIDHSAWTVALARDNAVANGLTGVRHERADWATFSPLVPFDLILGSDVLYDRDAHDAVLSIIARCLAPAGRVLLADPSRQDTPLFVRRLETRFAVVRTASLEQVLVPSSGKPEVMVTILDAALHDPVPIRHASP